MITVLLADDHDLVRTGIRRLLEDVDDIRVVGEAHSGEEAVRQVRELEPDVVLMDLSMPGMGGMEATRKIAAANPRTRVIVLTMHADKLYPQHLLKAGARGYLTKGASVTEIVHAIRQVMADRHYLSPEVAQQVALAGSGGEASPFAKLSERELQVLLMLMEGDRIADISRRLCLSPKTVSTYRQRLFAKLGVNSDVELARLAIRHGLVVAEDPAAYESGK